MPRPATDGARSCILGGMKPGTPGLGNERGGGRTTVRVSDGVANVRYESRGKLARRALELERLGYEIVSLNIGNPYPFGLRTPETMRFAMSKKLHPRAVY